MACDSNMLSHSPRRHGFRRGQKWPLRHVNGRRPPRQCRSLRPYARRRRRARAHKHPQRSSQRVIQAVVAAGALAVIAVIIAVVIIAVVITGSEVCELREPHTASIAGGPAAKVQGTGIPPTSQHTPGEGEPNSTVTTFHNGNSDTYHKERTWIGSVGTPAPNQSSKNQPAWTTTHLCPHPNPSCAVKGGRATEWNTSTPLKII